ncbi:MAG: ParA family protein [Planctomycetales bacterium]|nr:ParA family protein [Planctomycetales bacterium]
MPAVVISPVNRKGGVGKSSSVFHLGGYFASQGLRVLLIDNEPQHSLTNGLIGPDGAAALDPSSTTAGLFTPGEAVSPARLIRKTEVKNIDLVCGSDALDLINGPPEEKPLQMQLAIRRFVDVVRQDYDMILIDNPPNLQLCTYSSLASSNFTYCISKPQEYDVQGLVPVQKAIDRVLRTTNPTLRLAGYVLNMVQARRSLHAAYEDLLRQTYGNKVFATTIPDWNDFAEALTARKPISQYKPKSPAAKAIESLARELIDRVSELYRRPPEFQFTGKIDRTAAPSHARTEVVA